jgi:hypothetical protein
MLIFDTETDGFLEAVTKVHVMCIKDTITGVTDAYRNDAMQDGCGVCRRAQQPGSSWLATT